MRGGAHSAMVGVVVGVSVVLVLLVLLCCTVEDQIVLLVDGLKSEGWRKIMVSKQKSSSAEAYREVSVRLEADRGS